MDKNIEKIKYWPYFVVIFITLNYIIVFPSGERGFFLNFIAFLFLLLFVSRITLGIFMIFWGGSILGNIMTAFGIPYLGYPLFVSIGLLLLFVSKKDIYNGTTNWLLPISWIFITIAVLIIFFMYGPMTNYGLDKLLHFSIKTCVAIIAINYLINSKKEILWELGTLTIIASLVLYSLQIFIYPEFAPANMFQTAGLRIQLLTSSQTDFKTATNEIAMLASIGLSFLYSTFQGKYMSHTSEHKIMLFLYSAVALILINSAGQRLFFVIPLIAFSSLFLGRIKFTKYQWSIFILLCFVTFIFVWSIISGKIEIFRNDHSDFMNRTINWEAAINLIKEKPLLGYGVGGYFIEGYSRLGDAVYPHNLFLELLSETGVIGTTIILGYVLILFIIRNLKQIITFRTCLGNRISPFLTTIFIFSLISFDLRVTYLLFSVIAVIWANITYKKRQVNDIIYES